MTNMYALVKFYNSSIQLGHECSYHLIVNFGYDLYVDAGCFKVFYMPVRKSQSVYNRTVYNGGSKAPIWMPGRRRSCLLETLDTGCLE